MTVTQQVTEAEIDAVVTALRAWAIASFGWEEDYVDPDLPAGAKVAIEALDAYRSKVNAIK